VKFWAAGIGLPVVVLCGSVAFLVWLAYHQTPDLDRARAWCDREVPLLFTSHDPAELQRARILVHALNCDVWRRTPDPP
jgi:hypothetical protein